MTKRKRSIFLIILISLAVSPLLTIRLAAQSDRAKAVGMKLKCMCKGCDMTAGGCSYPGGAFSGPCETAKGMLKEVDQHIAKGETDDQIMQACRAGIWLRSVRRAAQAWFWSGCLDHAVLLHHSRLGASGFLHQKVAEARPSTHRPPRTHRRQSTRLANFSAHERKPIARQRNNECRLRHSPYCSRVRWNGPYSVPA